MGIILYEAARNKGAVAAVVQGHSIRDIDVPVVYVEDTLQAFQELAAAHRRRFRIPVVAVSGSNGKTTTKEMIGRVLSERFKTLVTEANYNNHIGVPQTLLRLTARHQAAVIEMGISGLGEMTRLCEIAAPTHGVLTNIGPTHLATLGTTQAVARAKGELVKSLPRGRHRDPQCGRPLLQAALELGQRLRALLRVFPPREGPGASGSVKNARHRPCR